MHFLLTNDDGILAPGLAALEQAIGLLPDAVCTIVAPAAEQSQCGHRVTTREPITVTEISAHRFSVEGTPADCVRLALFGLGLRPDFVISGINPGGNLGQDLHISGTVAGARLPAAAFSHYLLRDVALDWPRAAEWTRKVLHELLAQPLADGEFWNVNFPHLPPGPHEVAARVLCAPCRAPLNVSYESTRLADRVTSHRYTTTYSARPLEAESDVAVCFGGSIAVSRLHV